MAIDTFVGLIDAYLDDEIEDADLVRLKEWLLEDRSNVRFFVRRMIMHQRLREALLIESTGRVLGAPEVSIPDLGGASAEELLSEMGLNGCSGCEAPRDDKSTSNFTAPTFLPPAQHWLSWGWQSFALVGAATVTSVLLGMAILIGSGIWSVTDLRRPGGHEARAAMVPSFVAHLAATRDAQWSDPGAALNDFSYLSAGQELHLASGLVEIVFRDGAKVLVEGPAHFIATSREQCELRRGQLIARVSSQAMGFSVATPQGTVIGLGGEFGIAVDSDRASEVHMLSGEAELITNASSEESTSLPARRLTADQGCKIRFSENSVTPHLEMVTADAGRFVNAISTRVRPGKFEVKAIKPTIPVAGYLYDEPYENIGDLITDRFGQLHGSTSAVRRGEQPVDCSDVPFQYPGNRSLNTSVGNGGGSCRALPFKAVLNEASAFTFQAWVKYEQADLSAGRLANRIGAIHIDRGNLLVGVSVQDDNTIQIGARSQPSDDLQEMTTTGTLTPGQWNHVVVIVDFANDQIRASLNGSAFETTSVAFGSDQAILKDKTSGVRIPSSGTNRYSGLIDEVAFWNTAISASNIVWLHQNSLRDVSDD